MLVSAKEMLDQAKAGHYAVGQFNINNLEYSMRDKVRPAHCAGVQISGDLRCL